MNNESKLESVPEIVKLEKQLNKLRNEGFTSSLRGLSTKELEAKLLENTKEQHGVKTAREEEIGEEVGRLREEIKELEGPFKETLKDLKLQSRFMALLLKEKQ